jgi:hypothetical protein
MSSYSSKYLYIISCDSVILYYKAEVFEERENYQHHNSARNMMAVGKDRLVSYSVATVRTEIPRHKH